jgi:dinuclear metal center YbgI/SA1388 family protein
MSIKDIVFQLESLAPLSYQESYDNAGLITGDASWPCTGILVTLDCTEAVIEEAVANGCNLVVAHHPIIFTGLKKITGSNYVEKTVIASIKNNIAIYAIHTNLDNVKEGVNGKMADRLALQNCTVLSYKRSVLRKLFTFVPVEHAEKLRDALFAGGGGEIGRYSECSFNVEGRGSFKANEGTNPYVGKEGERHYENEVKVEVIYPAYLEDGLLRSMRQAHPYEEVAFDVVALENTHPGIGSGLIGDLPEEMAETAFLSMLKSQFGLQMVRHTPFTGKKVKKVALCGGAGSFLIRQALAAKADVYISSDIKYHEFFDANGRMVIADIGHYESEQFTTDLLLEILRQKFPTFALLKSKVITNPVHYFVG